MRRPIIMLWLLLWPLLMTRAQSDSRYEYWLDNDYASAVRGTAEVTSADGSQQDVSLTLDVDLHQVSPGLHRFNFRCQAANGEWGAISRFMFYQQSTDDADLLAAYEYWMDRDYEHRTIVAADTVPSALSIDISSLSAGMHFFNFRMQASDGEWGPLSRYLVYLYDDASNLELASIDYWIDDKTGKVTTLQASENQLMFSIDLSNLSNGVHNLYLEGLATTGIRCLLGQYEFELDHVSLLDYAYDGKTLRATGEGAAAPIVETLGDDVSQTICAIVWNTSTTLTENVMQGIENPNLLLYVSNKALAPDNVKNIVVGDSLSGYKAQQIVLKDTEQGNGNFYCPIAFTANRITYEREFLQYTEPDSCRGWETLVLPFAPQSIMHERNGVLRPFTAEGEGRPFWLREFNSNGFVDAKQIEANKPYVIAMPNHGAYDMEYRLGGWVTFSAYGCNVPKTSLHTATDSTGTIRFIPALSTEMQQDSVYALNVGEEYLVDNKKYAEGSIFVAGWSDVRPFHCFTKHVSSSAPAPRYIPLAGRFYGSTTDISEKVIVNSEEFLSEESVARNATAPVYNLKGQRVMQPTKGIYIVNGKKVTR